MEVFLKTGIRTLFILFCALAVSKGADVSGKWVGEIAGRGGSSTVTFTFKASSGSSFTGTLATARGEVPISQGKIDGDRISFSVEVAGRGGSPVETRYEGRIRADVIELSAESGRGSRPLTLRRCPPDCH